MNNKLLPIISLALTAVSIIVAVFSLITVLNISKNISAPETEQTEAEAGSVPLTDTTNFLLEDPVIAVLSSTEDAMTTMSVSITVGFRVDNTKKESADVLTLMTDNSDILKDRITKLIKQKTVEDMEEPNSDAMLQAEILELANKELDTDMIVEVYFKDSLQSKKQAN